MADLIRGIATGEWVYTPTTKEIATKQGLLEAFEALRPQTLEWWKKITADRLTAVEDDGFGWGPPTANHTSTCVSWKWSHPPFTSDR
jgi:hypothetical protein